ncbi:MAG: RNA-binding domain-containing protein [Bacteroidales bacterium]
MTKEELIQRLDDLEWEDFEVKEAKSEVPRNVRETVSAFSNTSGGWIIFGVKQQGKNYEIRGVEKPDKVEQDFTTSLRGDVYNIKISPECKKYNFDEGVVLGFKIPPSNKKPVWFNNPKNTFIRTSSGDQRATQEEVDAMYRDSAFGTKDSELTKFGIEDLNTESIDGYRNYLATINSSHPYNRYNIEKFLEKLRVHKDGKVTTGGLLFFGTLDSIEDLLTDFRIDLFEIPGTSIESADRRYTFRMPVQPNLFEYYFSIYPRLVKHIDIPFETDIHGMSVEEQPQVVAIREALVNMLMHSDYFCPQKPRIRIFTDRIEFNNPGALPNDLDTILREDLSKPRNPVIAKIFRVINLAQNAGYGFDKMINGWNSYYHTKPEIKSGTDFYTISFKVDKKYATRKDKSAHKKGSRTGGTTGGTTGGITGGTTGGIAGEKKEEIARNEGVTKLTPRQKEVYRLIKENPQISFKEIGVRTGIKSKSTIQKHILKLRELGLIERVGTYGGYWEIL